MSSSRRVVTVDCEYTRSQFAAAYLLVDGSGTQAEAAFVDNNTAHSVPLLLKALQAEGLKPEQVRYVIITHVHLDHAGGTSQLMKACPQATLLAHPRASRHMIDPTRLVSSAREVYGAEAFERMYGTIEPIRESRVRSVENEEHIPFGRGAPLRFFHTRGHANHHFCIVDPETSTVFTGDAFGLAYPALQGNGLFIIPSTSPTDFDYTEALKSLDLIVSTNARQACLTHFGAVTDLPSAAAQLREHLAFSQTTLEAAASASVKAEEIDAFCAKQHQDYFESLMAREGMRAGSEWRDLLRLDIELNAQGIAHAARKRREKAS